MKILSCLAMVLSVAMVFGATVPVEIDLFVAGGTLDAVRAAVQARAEGKNVFLAAPRPCRRSRAFPRASSMSRPCSAS